MTAPNNIASAKIDNFERNWQIYSELGGYERHFNNLQNSYRNLASTWLLAVFAGIGFMLVQRPFTVPLPIELTIAAIALGGSLGIYLLWNLDHMVYQRLLEAIFVEGYKMESNFNWLPNVRKNMIIMMRGAATGAPERAFIFYLAPQIILFLIFILAVTIWITKISPWSYSIQNTIALICILLSIVGFFAIVLDMNRNRLITRSLVENLLESST
jgi:hypothetical protein